MEMPSERILADNLARVRGQIDDAARQAGREPSSIRLIAVTKYHSPEHTRMLVQAGCHDLGESRPQELWEKSALLADLPIRWHFIGHLQRNKLARTLPLVETLHSIDSQRLLEAIDQQARSAGQVAAGLLEVNISGDANKHGFTPAEVRTALESAQTMSGVRITGLMGMASLEGGPSRARRDFAALAALRDQLLREVAPPQGLPELSMGMSGDFPEAIQEGATMVRVGSALFEGLPS